MRAASLIVLPGLVLPSLGGGRVAQHVIDLQEEMFERTFKVWRHLRKDLDNTTRGKGLPTNACCRRSSLAKATNRRTGAVQRSFGAAGRGQAPKIRRAAGTGLAKWSPLGSVGVEVAGINICRTLEGSDAEAAELADGLRAKMAEFGLVVVRGQASDLEGNNHVALSRCFGKVFDLPKRYQHARSPAPEILRLSNDPEEGKVGVGTSGWHIDGLTYPTPFAYALYHIISVPRQGATRFLRLEDLANSLLRQQAVSGGEAWDKLWLEVVGSQEGAEPVFHPLVFVHPRTMKPSVCLHTGKMRGFVWHRGTEKERATHENETKALRQRIQDEVLALPPESFYAHHWEEGDIIISDNLAVAHLASAETKLPTTENGLRVLHRTVLEGGSPLTSFSTL